MTAVQEPGSRLRPPPRRCGRRAIWWWCAPLRPTARSRRRCARRTVPIQVPRPGQFTMLYGYGVGEIPVSVSGIGAPPGQVLVQTIRAVGAVSRALCAARPGDMIGVRGPFG